MCLAVPRLLGSVTERDGARLGLPADGGAPVDLVFVPEAGAGDYVVVHAGFAVARLSPDAARMAIDLLEEAQLPAPAD